LAVPLDEVDEIRRQFGEIGQGLMHHNRSRSRSSGSGASRGTLGWDAFALHQKDGLIVFAGQDGAIAFDEHDGGSIGAGREGRNIIITLLETTHHTHNKPDGMGFSLKNPSRMGEDESDDPAEVEKLKAEITRGFYGD
jgi:hypothetical protein